MRSNVLATLTALAIGAIGLVLTGLGGAPAGSPRPTWPRGARYDYQLVWTADTEVGGQDNGPALTSKIDRGATLRFVSHGAHEGGWLLAATFVEIARPDVELLGRPGFADAAAARAELVGWTAWVVVDADGHVERIYFDATAPQAFKHLMQTVVGQITVGDGASWRAIEPGPSATFIAFDLLPP